MKNKCSNCKVEIETMCGFKVVAFILLLCLLFVMSYWSSSLSSDFRIFTQIKNNTDAFCSLHLILYAALALLWIVYCFADDFKFFKYKQTISVKSK